MSDKITKELFLLQDIKYRDFQSKLIPSVKKEKIVGVRTPLLRDYAIRLIASGEHEAFLSELPHRYFEEDQLHAFIISSLKDFDRCVFETDRFLPYIDNWATCDQLSPKSFKKRPIALLSYIKAWIASEKTYTIRFGIGMLMQHYLGEGFKTEYPDMVAEIRSKDYYVKMMVAWYFATALAKNYEQIIPFIEGRRLDEWTHNKAIRKALESYRISPEQKERLKSLKIK